jgi:hypothetical protein
MADETGWLCEDGSVTPSYITVVDGHLVWTTDSLKALRLARRADAEMIAEIVDDCWRVAEHMWPSSPLEECSYCQHCDRPINEVPFGDRTIWITQDKQTFCRRSADSKSLLGHEPKVAAPLVGPQPNGGTSCD